ncbi:hypothetical protein PG993_011660 [Apiospora rasikravindrae]|uniref:Uncharacterized protein n=1 Tax=Apiospora rasikravindrae TaxID=990691 RepID=A0ABR1S093_9PEZI
MRPSSYQQQVNGGHGNGLNATSSSSSTTAASDNPSTSMDHPLPVSPLDGTVDSYLSHQNHDPAQPNPSPIHQFPSNVTSLVPPHQVAYIQPPARVDSPRQPADQQARPQTPTSHGSGSVKAKPHDSKGKRPTSWWWWWEILATVLSIACMGALIVILTRIDNIPLPHWWLPIQPNSLIAVLTTVAKSSMMLSVASCISQLKWGHFSQQPRKLVDLETFDEASRGPWGSATLLWLLSFRAPILFTSGLALVTIVSLGIDPCAQQVLEFPTQLTPLDNITVDIGVANQYFSKGLLEDTHRSYIFVSNADLLHLQASIINSAVGTVFQPHVSCPAPATRCYWDEITTLGICSDYRDVTSTAVPNCTEPDRAGSINCTYTFPGMMDREEPDAALLMTWNQESTGGAGVRTMLFGSLFHPNIKADVPSFGSLTAIKAIGEENNKGHPTPVEGGGMEPPPVQVSYAEFGWCEQRYHNITATPAGISYADINMTSERLDRTHTPVTLPGQPGNEMGTYYESYVVNSTGQVYNISRMASILSNVLSVLLESSVHNNIYRPDIDQNIQFNLGYALMNSPFDKVSSDLAAALTNQIRSADPGDNYNATTVRGKAEYNETYIRVRWPWMILPLVEVVLAALLLLASIIVTGGMPLWKTSGLAFLVAGGWEKEQFNTFTSVRKGREKMDKETLEEWGKEVKARLISGGGADEEAKGGRSRFERVSD